MIFSIRMLDFCSALYIYLYIDFHLLILRGCLYVDKLQKAANQACLSLKVTFKTMFISSGKRIDNMFIYKNSRVFFIFNMNVK